MRLANLCWPTLLLTPLSVGCVDTPAQTKTVDLTANGADAGTRQRPAPDDDGMDAGLGPSGGSSDDAGSAGHGDHDAGPPVVGLNCESYCNVVSQACQGVHLQYQSREQCLAMCADTPLGTEVDTSGDTIGCRLYHAQVAIMMGDPVNHCPHAGATGGGVCGSRCESLCDRASKLCSEERGYPDAYPSRETCLALCAPETGLGFPADDDEELPATGNTVSCRIYHLRSAYLDIAAGSPNDHCPHVGFVSETCK